jgi:subtilisin family serine protease
VLLGTIALSPGSHSKTTQVPDGVLEGELLVKFQRAAKVEERVKQLGGERIREFKDLGWQLIRLPRGLSVADAVARYRAVPGVESVQPNFVYRTQATADDPRFTELYGLARIQAAGAWDRTTGSPSVIVAVIDLGVDYTHEDLNANMWRNPGETGVDGQGANKSSNGIDDDGNGYVDDVYGIDTINHDSNPMDDSGHGTHVAGTIGGVGNNGKGVVGVNWAVGIMAIKSHDQSGNGTSASVIEAYQYAAAMRNRGINIRVTNSSWGGAPEAPSYDQALKDAIDLAGNAGILNVCAAGNANNNNDATPFYPASYDSPSILSVAASDQNDNPASFTSYGANTVDIAAPGVGIVSTYPGNGYRFLSGTSMASPHVAGAAALLCAMNPYLNRTQLKTILMSSADPLPAQNWASKPIASAGRLNLLRALQSIPTSNQIDAADFFVRQHYLDFLGREPDAGGQSYWTQQLTDCGNNATCLNHRRIGVSGAFFGELEFQRTGSFVYRLYKGGLGRRPAFVEFANDQPLIVEGPNLEQTKQDFALAFVKRAQFVSLYANKNSAADFVDALLQGIQQAAGVNLSQRRSELITTYGTASDQDQSRAFALRAAIDDSAFTAVEYNPSFVLMEYFGYLRRDPDQAGYDFWLDVINNKEPNNYPSMICAFLTSVEYQTRFAPVVSRTNADCAP